MQMRVFFFYHTTKNSTLVLPQTFKVRDMLNQSEEKKLILHIPLVYEKKLFNKFCCMTLKTFLTNKTAEIVCFSIIRNFEFGCILI